VKITAGSVVVGYLDNGSWSACFGLSYRDLTLFDLMKSRRIVRNGGRELRSLCTSGNLPDSRNDVVRAFLDTTDGEWLFFVDTDMGFSREIVDDLVTSAHKEDRPVVGALCFAARRGPVLGMYADTYHVHPTMYQKNPDGMTGFTPYPRYPIDAVVPVDATGTAAILVHRSVLDAVREKFGTDWFTRVRTEDGEGFYSEDLSFCIRLAELGVPMHVNTAVRTTHHKGLVYLDEELYLTSNGLTREGVDPGGLPRPVRDES
jgi:hypothetical protein